MEKLHYADFATIFYLLEHSTHICSDDELMLGCPRDPHDDDSQKKKVEEMAIEKCTLDLRS